MCQLMCAVDAPGVLFCWKRGQARVAGAFAVMSKPPIARVAELERCTAARHPDFTRPTPTHTNSSSTHNQEQQHNHHASSSTTRPCPPRQTSISVRFFWASDLASRNPSFTTKARLLSCAQRRCPLQTPQSNQTGASCGSRRASMRILRLGSHCTSTRPWARRPTGYVYAHTQLGGAGGDIDVCWAFWFVME